MARHKCSKLNKQLSWVKGSWHFKSLNLNRWLAILSIFSGLPLVSADENMFTSIMQFDSLIITSLLTKIITHDKRIHQPEILA